MTRTQFFGLDNLPSPTADRKSNDSVSSLNFKPDLPQKPKIPKRPMVLGLNSTTAGGTAFGNNKSDEESTPTNNTTDCSTTQTNGTLRGHKTAEQLVQEHCDNVTALQANIGSSNTSIPSAILKESNYNNHNLLNTSTFSHSSLEVNANAPAPLIPPPPAVTMAKVMTTNNSNSSNNTNNSNLNNLSNINTTMSSSTTTLATTTTSLSSSASASNSDKPLAEIRLTTPTTPVSPNMIMTPKRPTVPAPPPPTSAKKQQE